MFQKSTSTAGVMGCLWPILLCLLLLMKPTIVDSSSKEGVDSHLSTKEELTGDKPSAADTKLALDSLDRVLENSKALRDQLRTLLQSRSSHLRGKRKQDVTHGLEHHERLKSTRYSRERMQKDLDRELQNQILQGKDGRVIHTATKTAVREAKSEDTKADSKHDSIVVPPPPWKLKIKFPPPPPPPPNLSPKNLKKTSKAKREEKPHKKPVSVSGDIKAGKAAVNNPDKIGLQNSEIQSNKPKSREVVLPPPPKNFHRDAKENIKQSVSSSSDDAVSWSKWTPFSECHIDLEGRCIQRRQRRCLIKNPTLCAGADKFGVETQLKECVVGKCKTSVKTTCADKDDHFKCRFLARHGKCDKEPDHMWSVCCRSCRECVDKDGNCQKRASVGDCEKFKEYMTKRCPSSCNICNKVK